LPAVFYAINVKLLLRFPCKIDFLTFIALMLTMKKQLVLPLSLKFQNLHMIIKVVPIFLKKFSCKFQSQIVSSSFHGHWRASRVVAEMQITRCKSSSRLKLSETLGWKRPQPGPVEEMRVSAPERNWPSQSARTWNLLGKPMGRTHSQASSTSVP
jgi:hypothetical protein